MLAPGLTVFGVGRKLCASSRVRTDTAVEQPDLTRSSFGPPARRPSAHSAPNANKLPVCRSPARN